ncbi:prohibitin family protein [Candidatus Pacearchaeota archaeon]|nr:prohibitin family protein [Candidatus Pacearchaeota archaeon]
MNYGTMRNLILGGVAAGLMALTGISSYHTTDATEVGVRTKKLFGKGVEDKVYQPGSSYFFLPFLNDWDTFDTRLKIVEMSKNSPDPETKELRFKTIEGNDLEIDLVYSYRIDPEQADHIRQFVAANDEELQRKVFNTIARSRPRDFFGELTTEQFYTAENRNNAAEKAREALQKILKPYGIIVEKVAPKDYRFVNPKYAEAIKDRKLADAQVLELESQIEAQREMNKKLLQDAAGGVNKKRAEIDGRLKEAVIKADAYMLQQGRIAEALLAEGKANAEGIAKEREAMASTGGETMVKMKLAEVLQGKRIIMVPETGGMGLTTFDMNEFLKSYGAYRLSAPATVQK